VRFRAASSDWVSQSDSSPHIQQRLKTWFSHGQNRAQEEEVQDFEEEQDVDGTSYSESIKVQTFSQLFYRHLPALAMATAW
jgi:hypothetical protein